MHQLRVFACVADTRSFTGAAGELHLSQPVVSRTVRELERLLGVDLLRRTTRSVELTPAGRELRSVTADIFTAFDRGLARFDRFNEGTAGAVVLAALPSVTASLVPSMITGFRSRFGDIDVQVRDGASSEVTAMLRRGDADLAIADAGSASPDLEARTLMDDQMVAVLPTDHALAGQPVVSWSQLAQDTFVALPLGTSIRRLTDLAFQQAGLHPTSVLETGAVSSAGAVIAAGLGVTAVPDLALPLLAFATVTRRPLHQPTITRRITLLSKPDDELSAAARRFRDHLVHSAAARCAGDMAANI